jgi:hypothetical protein
MKWKLQVPSELERLEVWSRGFLSRRLWLKSDGLYKSRQVAH